MYRSLLHLLCKTVDNKPNLSLPEETSGKLRNLFNEHVTKRKFAFMVGAIQKMDVEISKCVSGLEEMGFSYAKSYIFL